MKVPEYGEKEQKYEMEEFEKPQLLFPMEQVKYLGDIYQVLPSQVPNQMEERYLAGSQDLAHSSISGHRDMTPTINQQLVHASWQ